MPASLLLIMGWIMVAGIAAPAAPDVDEGGTTRKPPNAATEYRLAWDMMAREDIREVLGAGERRDGAGWRLSDAERQALNRLQPALDRIKAGSAVEHCDFGVDHDTWFPDNAETIELIHTSRLLAIDARDRVDRGDRAGAILAVAAAYRFAQHICTDRLVWSSMHAISGFRRADRVAIHLAEQRPFGVDEAAVLRQALQRFNPTDPFLVVEAIRLEGTTTAALLRNTGRTSSGRRRFIAEFDSWPIGRSECQIPWYGMSLIVSIERAGGFDVAADGVEDVCADVANTLAARADLRVFKLIDRAMDNGRYGVFAQRCLFPWRRFCQAMLSAWDSFDAACRRAGLHRL